MKLCSAGDKERPTGSSILMRVCGEKERERERDVGGRNTWDK